MFRFLKKANSDATSVDEEDIKCAQVSEKEFVPPEPAEMRKLLWKLDLHIIPYVSLLYLISFLDRVNIGNAKIAGLMEDIEITEDQYNWALSIFFIAYILFEVPSNLVLKRLGARIWIPIIMFVWGVIMAAMAACKTGEQLMVARFFLGAAESGLYPGIIFYISLFYKRREQTTRIACFFGSSTLAGAFGGVLAYGIIHMDGLQGLSGWQWIFIIEALPPLVLPFVTYFVLSDSPEAARFLTKRERQIAVYRLQVDAGPAMETEFSWKQCRFGLTDWKVIYYAFMNLAGLIPMFSLSMFMPSIVRDMGYESLEAQALTAPPYAVAFVVTIAIAMNADRIVERGHHASLASFVGVIGYLLLIVLKDHNVATLYVSACIATIGSFAQVPPRAAWSTSNIGGQTKRAVGIAMISNLGNIGGAVAGHVYRQSDAPHYIRGHAICLGMMVYVWITCVILKFALKCINKKRESLSAEEYQRICQKTELCDEVRFHRYLGRCWFANFTT
ncbi:major facilitator superfamily domain-containing protein [Fennellomyces sp. T-0311]|nr:major facilitator superfamily domain-containing protein [Fennellomyces sp. T-0311]